MPGNFARLNVGAGVRARAERLLPLCTFVSFVVPAFEIHQPRRTRRYTKELRVRKLATGWTTLSEGPQSRRAFSSTALSMIKCSLSRLAGAQSCFEDNCLKP